MVAVICRASERKKERKKTLQPVRAGFDFLTDQNFWPLQRSSAAGGAREAEGCSVAAISRGRARASTEFAPTPHQGSPQACARLPPRTAVGPRVGDAGPMAVGVACARARFPFLSSVLAAGWRACAWGYGEPLVSGTFGYWRRVASAVPSEQPTLRV